MVPQRLAVVLLILIPFALPIGSPVNAEAGGAREAAFDSIERGRSARRAAATEQLLVLPHLSLVELEAGVDEAELILLGRFADPIPVEVELLTPAGERFPVTRPLVEPASFTTVDLLRELGPAGSTPLEGALHVRFQGDPEMLQGWVILTTGASRLELPLENPEAGNEQLLVSFWDRGALPGAEPRFDLHNASELPIVATLRLLGRHGELPVRTLSLPPGGSVVVDPPADLQTGSVELRHSGAPGMLRMSGLLVLDGRPVSRLPVSSPREPEARSRFTTIPLPATATDAHPRTLRVSLLDERSGGRPQAVVLSLLDAATGAVLERRRSSIDAGAVETLDLSSLVNGVTRTSRLQIEAGLGGLLVWGSFWEGDPAVAVDLSFVSFADAHASGQYPILDLEEHEVVTSLVNLGERPVRIVAQLRWGRDRSYTLPALLIPAGAAHRLDLTEIVRAQLPDLLGRVPPGDLREGFLQWLVDGSGGHLIARTEARRREAEDRIGFDCFACCSKQPFGVLLPASAHFPLGGSTDFQTCVSWFTCSGEVGPVAISGVDLTYSSPFSWTGSIVSSSAAALQEMRFDGTEEAILEGTCTSMPSPISEIGDAVAYEVRIHEADFVKSRIRVSLKPSGVGATGQLKVFLKSRNGVEHVLFQGSKSGGDHTFDFGDPALYPDGEIFEQVHAEWKPMGVTVSAVFPIYVEVLGSYKQTCYNSVLESEYFHAQKWVGTSTDACVWNTEPFLEDYLTALNCRGSGFDIFGRAMQPEFFCSPPSNSPEHCSIRLTDGATVCRRYRVGSTITTSCGPPFRSKPSKESPEAF